IAEGNILVEVQSLEIPFGILENRLSIIRVAETELNGPLRLCRCDPGSPAARRGFGARRITGINLRAGARVLRTGVNLPQCFDLLSREALRSVRVFAGEHGGIEAAHSRIFADAVLDAIQSIA